jgi:hypothetical protein
VTAQPIEAVASIVISQVYGGGGNVGATYNADFVELYNRGDHALSLAGWSIQYAPASGSMGFGSSSATMTVLPSVTLQPGHYFLVQGYSYTNGAALPTPDAVGRINLAQGAGKVALTRTTSALGCNGGALPCSAAQLAKIIDLVGYGTADFFEGQGPAPAPSNINSVQRLFGGCLFADSNNNKADLVAAAVQPRNVAVVQTCSLIGATP